MTRCLEKLCADSQLGLTKKKESRYTENFNHTPIQKTLQLFGCNILIIFTHRKILSACGDQRTKWEVSLCLCLGSAALLIHRAISLPPIGPLNPNKRGMLLLVAMDHGCPDIVWCSWGMLKVLRSLCFYFKAPLSLSHTQTFTFPGTHATFPYLFSHTLSCKKG